MRYLLTCVVSTLLALLTTATHATEPLHDGLVFQGKSGIIYPVKCCWMELPSSEALTAIRRKELCSAIGGPVGNFRLQDGKLWLTELSRCSGTIPLSQVFSDLANPAHAIWVTGAFVGKLNWLCLGNDDRSIFELELSLQIERGVVVSISEYHRDKSKCPTQL